MLSDHQTMNMKLSLAKKPDLKDIPLIIEKLRNENLIEHLYFVKRNTAYLWFEGERNYVLPQPEKLLRMNDALVLHNHINGTSFSYEEIDAITKYNANELMVICKARTYSVKRPSGGWSFSFEREKDYEQYQNAFNEGNEYIDLLIQERKLEERERNDFLNHITWKIFFPKFGIEYKPYGL